MSVPRLDSMRWLTTLKFPLVALIILFAIGNSNLHAEEKEMGEKIYITIMLPLGFTGIIALIDHAAYEDEPFGIAHDGAVMTAYNLGFSAFVLAFGGYDKPLYLSMVAGAAALAVANQVQSGTY